MLIRVCGWLLMSGRRSALTLRMMSTPPVLSSATWVATSGMARKTTYLNGRLAAPVLVEGFEPDVLVALPLHELPGAGAHRRPCCRTPPSPTFSTCFLGTMREEHEALEQERERLVGDQMDRVRVDDLHFLDRADVAVLGRLLLLLARLQHPVERELHVLGRHGGAVVELDALAELELPRRVVERLPRQGQRGLELQLRAAVQERVEHVDVDEDADALEVHVRVEGRRVRRQRDGERVLALRAGAERQGDERSEVRARSPGSQRFMECPPSSIGDGTAAARASRGGTIHQSRD